MNLKIDPTHSISLIPESAKFGYATLPATENFFGSAKWLESSWMRECLKRLESVQNAAALFYKNKGTSSSFGSRCLPIGLIEEHLSESIRESRPCLIPDEEALRQYGNKHLNLVKMAHLDDILGLPDLEIPLPRGVATAQVEAFLQKKAPEVFENWNKLGKLYAEFGGAGPFLADPEAVRLLQEIDRLIEAAFKSPDAANGLRLSPSMLGWMEGLKQKGEFLMVRSTGAEDSKQLANAGGNLSKAYVPASTGILCSSIGEVVRSYFGAQSLQNRLNAGYNPFEEPLSLAVTVQELVGEPVGRQSGPSEIPVSFVLFTNEPLYTGGEKFRAMRLSAAYGHGESVVGNTGVPTDTALFLHSEVHPDTLHLLYDNQVKPTRLAPINWEGTISLEKVPNPGGLETQPALSQSQLLAIYRHGVLMESFFDGHPTDIEGVVKGDRIYFVQARPVNRKPMLPTYLDVNEGQFPKAQAETLVAGKASVVTIAKPEEILFTQTLEMAERLFRPEHKLIVVAKSEPENSHPVVNFSSLGIPCLYASNARAVSDLLAKLDPEHPIAACMQTGTLHLWDQTALKLEERIKEGFAIHPAKVAISLPIPEKLTAEDAASLIPRELLEEIRSGSNGLAALKELERHPEVLRLRSIISELAGQKGSLPKAALIRLESLEQIDAHISSAIEEMKGILSQRRPDGRLRRLLHAKILETALRAPKSPSALGRYGLSDVEPLYRSIGMLVDYQRGLSHPARCVELLLAGAEANPIAFGKWKEFLTGLEALVESGRVSEERLQEFSVRVATIQKTGALPFWLTFFQPQEKSKASSDGLSIRRFEDLMSQMGSKNQKLMDQALLLQKKTLELRNSIERFADPKSFPAAWKEYESLPPLLYDAIKAASPIARSVAASALEQKVDLLDTAAKILKASQQFGPEEKTKLFKQMLQSYFAMMRGFVDNLVPNGAIPMHENWPLNVYLDTIRLILNRLPAQNPEQLRPSMDFSVSAAMLGSGAAFERHLPKTMEDIFTLTHQNCLASLNAHSQEMLGANEIQQSLLPLPIKAAIEAIEKQDWGRQVQRLGIEVRPATIILRYNVPLRNHSGHLELHYDIGSGKMVLHAQLLGEARNRWDDTERFISDLENIELYTSFQPRTKSASELTFSWSVAPEQLIDALRDYAKMAEYSLDANVGHFNLYNRLKGDAKKIKQIAELYFSGLNPIHHPFYESYIEAGQDLEIVIEAARANIASDDLQSRKIARELFKSLLEKDKGFEAAIEAVKAGISSDDSFTRRTARDLFEALVRKDQGVEAAIKAAKTSILSDDLFTRITALDLFEALVRKDQGFEAAIEAATDNIVSNNWEARPGALHLFKALFEKGQGFEAAIEAATGNIISNNWEARAGALDLFKELVRKNKGFEAAIEVAKTSLSSDDWSIKRRALDLFEALVEKDQGFGAAIEAARANIASDDFQIRRLALELFKALVEKGQGFEAAIEAVKASISIDDLFTRITALDLFEALVEKDQGFEAAIEAARANIASDDFQIRAHARNLFKALVRKDQGFEAALNAAKASISSDDLQIRTLALDLFKALVEQGQGFEAALNAAKASISSGDSTTRWAALDLFKALFEEGQGFEAAIKTAKASFVSDDGGTRRMARNLFKALVEKDRGFEAAIESIKAGTLSDDVFIKHETLEFLSELSKENDRFRSQFHAYSGLKFMRSHPILSSAAAGAAGMAAFLISRRRR